MTKTLQTQKNNLFIYCFLLAGILDLVAILLQINVLEWIAKPLIVLSALFFLDKSWFVIMFTKTQDKNSFLNVFAIWGLFFCWIGDILLMFDNYFLIGLGSFLLGHICFWRASAIFADKKEFSIQKKWWQIVPFIVYLVAFLSFLLPKMKNDIILQIAVCVYALGISISGIIASMKNKYFYIFVGFLFFIASDSYIAYQKFVLQSDFIAGRMFVMFTYIIAIALITYGYKIENQAIKK